MSLHASILVSLVSGFLLVEMLWPAERWGVKDFALKLCLAAGLGPGLTGCIAFVLMLAGQFSRNALVAADLVVLVVLALLVARASVRRNRIAPIKLDFASLASTRWPVILLGCGLVILTVVGLRAFLTGLTVMPEGAWDAWAFWDLRAKYLVLGDPTHWRVAFEAPAGMIGFHPDYPPLFPMMIANAWEWIGGVDVSAQYLLSGLFLFGAAGLLVFGLRAVSTTGKALLAGIVLLGMPHIIRHATWQYADTPLSFFFLATVVLMTLHERLGGKHPGLLALAGFACGLAGFTKNEGILFLVVAAGVWTIVTLMRGEKGTRVKHVAAFAAGLIPMLVLLFYFKTSIAPATSPLGPEGADPGQVTGGITLAKATLILKAMATMLFSTGEGGFPPLWGLFPFVLPFYLVLTGVQIDPSDPEPGPRGSGRGAPTRRSAMVCIAVVVLMTGGYFMVYLTTAHEVQWLLNTTLSRLFVQIWPAAIFTLFLISRPWDADMVIQKDAGKGGPR